jgi:hypothetical protein
MKNDADRLKPLCCYRRLLYGLFGGKSMGLGKISYLVLIDLTDFNH